MKQGLNCNILVSINGHDSSAYLIVYPEGASNIVQLYLSPKGCRQAESKVFEPQKGWGNLIERVLIGVSKGRDHHASLEVPYEQIIQLQNDTEVSCEIKIPWLTSN